MTRKTKFLGSTTGLLAAAAFSGLLAGASHASAATTIQKNMSAKTTLVAKAGVKANMLDAGTHDCKGKNSCKGQGGCKTSDQGCKGKNSCKGNGGCKVAATQPSL